MCRWTDYNVYPCLKFSIFFTPRCSYEYMTTLNCNMLMKPFINLSKKFSKFFDGIPDG